MAVVVVVVSIASAARRKVHAKRVSSEPEMEAGSSRD